VLESSQSIMVSYLTYYDLVSKAPVAGKIPAGATGIDVEPGKNQWLSLIIFPTFACFASQVVVHYYSIL